MRKTLYLLCGIPGCGKTTYARAEVDRLFKQGRTVGYISRDDIRFALLRTGEDYFAHEDDVFKEFIRRINDSLAKNEITFADATHISEASREKVLRQVSCEDLDIVPIFFRVPLEVCLERNAKREGRAQVPEKAIRNMSRSLTNPFFDSRDYARTETIMFRKDA